MNVLVETATDLLFEAAAALPTWWRVDAGWGWLTSTAKPHPAWVTLAVVLGLCAGSFLNVLIYRMPRDQSIVWPGSRCPGCGHALSAWENVPLLSFLLLAGRCRACRAPIPWRYPLVEALSGLVAGLAVWRLGPGAAALWAAAFALALLAVGWIDAEHGIVPDELSAGLVALGLWVRGPSVHGFVVAALGGLLGFVLLWGLASLYRRVRGIEGLGGGDVKLAAGLGAFLGPPGLVLTVVLASLGGSVAGLLLIVRGRGNGKTALPFASFLAPAGVLVLIAGASLWRSYLGLAGITP